jgi:hypothetical protein
MAAGQQNAAVIGLTIRCTVSDTGNELSPARRTSFDIDGNVSMALLADVDHHYQVIPVS